MDVQSEIYRLYQIKSGVISGKWLARALRRGKIVAEATGENRDQAIDDVKAHLDEIDAIELSQRDEEGAPSAEKYIEAFLQVSLTDGHVAMLKAHLHAPNHLISATKLAEAAGYENYNAANLQYGLVGEKVANEIGFDPPKRSDGSSIWTCAIARSPDKDTEFPDTSMLDALSAAMEAGHFEWQMRPQVVQALRKLGY